MDLQAEQWFPTTIWTTKLDDIDNDKLKSLALNTMKNDQGVVKSNRNGWQSDGMDPGKHQGRCPRKETHGLAKAVRTDDERRDALHRPHYQRRHQ